MKNYFRDKKYLKWLFKAPKENTEHFEGMVAFAERYKNEATLTNEEQKELFGGFTKEEYLEQIGKPMDDFLKQHFEEERKIALEEAILFQFPKIKRSEISYTVEGLQIDTVSGISQKEVIEFV